MKRVFLTGASSYLGGRLAHHLLDAGWAVTAAEHSTPLAAALVARAGFSRVRVEDSPTSWTAALQDARPDAVVHLAARPGTEPTGDGVRDQLRGNLEIGVLLLDAMRAAGCRALVNTGTFWQYGDGPDPRPTCLYAVAKAAFETFIDHAVSQHGLRAVTLVLYDVYGEDDPRDKLLRQLARAAIAGTPLDLTPGEQLVDLVHVDDVVAAYALALARVGGGEARHERYALSSGAPAPLRQRVEEFGRALGRPLPVRWGGRPYRPREVMVPGRGPALPGWSPRVAPAAGLARVAQACRMSAAGGVP